MGTVYIFMANSPEEAGNDFILTAKGPLSIYSWHGNRANWTRTFLTVSIRDQKIFSEPVILENYFLSIFLANSDAEYETYLTM